MLTLLSLLRKAWPYLLLTAVIGGGIWYLHHRWFNEGAASVQAQWDDATHQAQAKSAQQSLDWLTHFNTIAARYEDAIHAPQRAVADSVAAGVRIGALRLRDVPPESCPGRVSDATASSRAADAAATQALADRVQAAIEIVRIGDEADAREHQLDAQIIGLQDTLKAERQ